MASGMIAALVATLAVGFVEGMGRFYPSKPTWWKLRRARGRESMRSMRERFEQAAARKTSRRIVLFLLVLVIAWVASASLLDKRWYEVVLDVFPYALVGFALLRIPAALRAIADRMKDYEREVGEDPDAPLEGGPGPSEIVL